MFRSTVVIAVTLLSAALPLGAQQTPRRDSSAARDTLETFVVRAVRAGGAAAKRPARRAAKSRQAHTPAAKARARAKPRNVAAAAEAAPAAAETAPVRKTRKAARRKAA